MREVRNEEATCYSVVVLTRERILMVSAIGSLGAILMGVYSNILNQYHVSVPLHCLVHLAEFLVALAFAIPMVSLLERTTNRFHAVLAYASFMVVAIGIVAVRMQFQIHYQSKVFDTLPYAAFAPLILLRWKPKGSPGEAPPPEPCGRR